MGTIKKAIGYIRVSTTEQAEEGYSLDNQRNDIEVFCEKENLTLVEVYADEGISGASLQREGIQKALQRLEVEDITYLVVWKLSRLTRRVVDVCDVVKVLEGTGTHLYSIKDTLDTSSPTGKPFLYMASIFAEIERENIITQVRGGMAQKARQGEWLGGRPPLGYTHEDGRLIVVEEQAEIVRTIFDLYLAGSGYLEIAEKLNNKGLKTSQNRAFSISSVKGILKNRSYTGQVEWGKLTGWGKKDKDGKRKRVYSENPTIVEGKHDAIISVETYERVQAKIDSNPRRNVRRFTNHHLLSGILRCPECGAGMSYQKIMSKGKPYEYYSCNTYQNKKQCHPHLLRKDKVDADFMSILTEIVEDKDFVHLLQSSVKDKGTKINALNTSIAKLEKEIQTLKGKQDALVDRLLSTSQSTLQESFERGIEKLQEDINLREGSIRKLKLESTEIQEQTLDAEEIKLILSKAGKMLTLVGDKETKQKLVRKLVEGIQIDEEKGTIKSVKFAFLQGEKVLELGEVSRTVSQVTLKPHKYCKFKVFRDNKNILRVEL